MRRLCLLFALFLVPVVMFAQSNPLLKKLERVSELYQKGKLDDADEYLVKVLDKNPDFSEGWDMLVALRGEEWEKAQDFNLQITTKDKSGKEVQDSLADKLASMLNNMSFKKIARSKYMYTMREALLHAPEAYKSSMLWRMYNIDVNVDSNVSRKALKYYKEAEKEYGARNFGSAAQLYRRAIEEQPDFYKAKLYLGDALYASENYTDALLAFREATERFPDQLEPQKYLCDAYAKLKMYDKALEAAIVAMSIYPDIAMVAKMEDAAYLANRRIEIKKTLRAAFPNQITAEDAGTDINEYKPKDDEKTEVSGPWKSYVAALSKAKPHCDSRGVVTNPAALDGQRYLELYSWQQMLKESTDPSLEEAQRMQAAGYLDCYVLVTCYHPDIYSQYKDFTAKNKEKINRYYHAFLKDAN